MSETPARPRSRRSFADHPAALKVLLLIGCVGAATLAVKGLAALAGARGLWAELDDRNVSQFLFLAGAVLMMAVDRISPAECGMAFVERWGRRLVLGFLLGVGVVAGYYAVAAGLDALELRTERIGGGLLQSAMRLLRAGARSTMAHVAACGYVLAVLRRSHGIGPAVPATAVLFACLYDPAEIPAILAGPQFPYFVGVVLGMVLLCLLRLAAGNLLPGIGLLAGWLFVQDVVRRGRLVQPSTDGAPDVIAWVAPEGEILRAPSLWVLLGLGILVLVVRLRRHGEPAIDPERRGMPASLKRVYPLAQPMAFAPLDLWLARLFHARFRVGLAYLPRLCCTLLLSAGNTLISLPERLFVPLILPFRRVPDPVFVLGVHRSGTTHLHNLLALDPRYVAPRLYQVSNPLGFLVSGWLAVPVLACAPSRRPMDNMAMHVFAPSEDEFALANSTGLSPYWGPVFPSEVAYYDRCFHPEDLTASERKRWERAYLAFLRRLVLFSRRRPLLKNPFNTARVAVLQRLFPQARFVHIARHPEDVYRSNMTLNEQGFVLFQMQDPDASDSFETRFCDKYRRMEEAWYRDAAHLPDGHGVEIRFEDLERDPVATIESIYAAWGVPMTAEYRARLAAYLEGIAGYRKNVHSPLDPAVARELNETLGPLLARWGYTVPR